MLTSICSIILVQGLGSNPDTTWQKLAKSDSESHTDPSFLEKKYVNWVTDFLCEDIPPDLRQHTRVFFYNYDSYWKRDAIEERRSRLGLELFEEVTSREVKASRLHRALKNSGLRNGNRHHREVSSSSDIVMAAW
jgi:hypothetical protein